MKLSELITRLQELQKEVKEKDMDADPLVWFENEDDCYYSLIGQCLVDENEDAVLAVKKQPF